MQRRLRTRLAPTPSGYLHLGNAFSFALTAAMAKRSGARILLRIDDLDRARIKRAYVEDIFDTLAYLEIPWNEGPRDYREYETVYAQVHRLPLYDDALRRLRERDAIFACDCSRSSLMQRHPQGYYTGTCKHRGLPLDGAGYSWRVDTSTAAIPAAVRDFVVRKKDGFPAYQLASVVDDVHFGVDLIVRGMDLQESTQAQLYLADLLGYVGFTQATFHHHGLLTVQGNEKLSKSAGATSIQALRREGMRKADAYRLIGQHVGLAEPVSDWETLGNAVLGGQ